MTDKAKAAELGKRITAIRHQRGLSQATVARRVGVDPSYLSRIENEKVHPTVGTAVRIAVALRFAGRAPRPVDARAKRKALSRDSRW